MRLPQLLATFGLVFVTTIESRGEDVMLRDLSVEQANAYQAGLPRPGSLRVSAWVDRQDLTYSRGETVRIFVQANEDAYVTIVNVGPAGRVTQLFPNAFQPDNRVAAGQSIEIPSPDSGARITVTGPVGAELIKVFASSAPMQVIPEAQLQGGGVFLTMRGEVSDLVRNLEVTANAPAVANGKFAISNMVLKTVTQRRSASVTGTSFVVLPGPLTLRPASVPAPTPAPSPSEIVPPMSAPQASAAPAPQPAPTIATTQPAAAARPTDAPTPAKARGADLVPAPHAAVPSSPAVTSPQAATVSPDTVTPGEVPSAQVSSQTPAAGSVATPAETTSAPN